jgi:F0F1-type ATP synthase membrane subunit a
MSITLYNVISIISIMLTICTILGGIWAFHNGAARTATEVQERVINALETELTAMREKMESITKENMRLSHTIATICAALKSRGIVISIDGDMVSIKDDKGSTTTRIQEDGSGKI